MNFYIEELVLNHIKENDKYSFINANDEVWFGKLRRMIFLEFFGILKQRITRDIVDNLGDYIDKTYDAYTKDKKICEKCHGHGKISAGIPVSMAYHGTSYEQECPKCDGDGYIYDT